MVYEFDFEITCESEYIIEKYSAKCNKVVDKSRLKGEGMVYIILSHPILKNYKFDTIFNNDIIVMGWKDGL